MGFFHNFDCRYNSHGAHSARFLVYKHLHPLISDRGKGVLFFFSPAGAQACSTHLSPICNPYLSTALLEQHPILFSRN